MAIPIQLRFTNNLTPATIPSADASSPSHLLEGEVCFALAGTPPNATKMWVGDATSNRLLLSTVDSDTPLLTARYLKLSGGQQLTGALTTTRTTFANDELVTKDFVDQAVAAGAGYRGTFDPSSAADINAINAATKANGYYWMAEVGGTTPTPTPVLPGIAPGTAFNPGDQIVWDDTSSTFAKIAAGGLTQPDADARYLQLGASNLMTTGGAIRMPAAYAPAVAADVATMGYVGTQLGNYLSLNGGIVTGDTIVNRNTAAPSVLPGDTNFRVIGADNTSPHIFIEAFGDLAGHNPVLSFRRANGTATLPTDPTNGENLGAINFQSGANLSGVFWARMRAVTSESWVGGTNHGCHITFDVTANGPSQSVILSVVDITADGLAVDGRATLAQGPRTTGGDNDVVRKQDVDAAITKISGGTF